ncbi:MAG: hypothetical protein K0S02_1663 [Achromobacter mucicolens]|jgi:hypothetical protein|uniref:hypothetical protein n=1 Tax=Achromobacter mucicolens TaxID=1389922 RepID=UPI00242A868C|nr:hypothetical protein [Achromobacter mucicolens]MDF2861391.1 hypothetical protein [Achromobacter mucicolens]
MWGSIVGSFLGAAIVTGLGLAWRSYFSEKGKNLATKQDIGVITAKIEEVKTEHARSLEAAKVTWAARSSLYTYRYQREYEILRKLGKLLVEVKNGAEFFAKYPPLPKPSDRAKDRRKERARELQSAINRLKVLRDEVRPFCPEEIHAAVGKLLEAGFNEVNYVLVEDIGLDRQDFGHEAIENAQAIEESASHAIEVIRDRVNEWERFSIPD